MPMMMIWWLSGIAFADLDAFAPVATLALAMMLRSLCRSDILLKCFST